MSCARAGKSVLVVERGNFAGAKNMTGGRHLHPLPEKRVPRLTSYRRALRAQDRPRAHPPAWRQTATITIDFSSDAMNEEETDILLGAARPLRPVARRARPRTPARSSSAASPSRSLVKDEGGKVRRHPRRRGRDHGRGRHPVRRRELAARQRGRGLREAPGDARWPSASRRFSSFPAGTIDGSLPGTIRRRGRCVAVRRRRYPWHLRRWLHVHQQGLHLPGRRRRHRGVGRRRRRLRSTRCSRT